MTKEMEIRNRFVKSCAQVGCSSKEIQALLEVW